MPWEVRFRDFLDRLGKMLARLGARGQLHIKLNLLFPPTLPKAFPAASAILMAWQTLPVKLTSPPAHGYLFSL